jgi:putative ABC transport system permease protein
MLARGVRPALVGSSAGLILAYSTSHVLSSLLFQVQPTDALTFAATAAGLLLVTLAASYIPARRAASVDPIVVLRDE